MPGVILVVLDTAALAARLLDAARRLGDLCGATRINVLLVRAPPETMIAPSEEVLTSQRETALRAVENRRATEVRAVFDNWAASLPGQLKAEWIDSDGIAELLVEERGRRADFLVVHRPAHQDYGTSWHALRASLFTTDRPVLVIPEHTTSDFGRRIAIAWRDDERATKALLAALRWIQGAERVFVLTGTRAGNAPSALPPILVEHGVSAELHVLPIGGGPLGAALLAKAHELGADMLVMGAYQHNPIRELLLGGVTRYVLNNADMPVLMRH